MNKTMTYFIGLTIVFLLFLILTGINFILLKKAELHNNHKIIHFLVILELIYNALGQISIGILMVYYIIQINS